MNPAASLLSRFDPETGVIDGVQRVSRRLADLNGTFVDDAAYKNALHMSNPVVYSVSTVTPGHGEGDLHYGIGVVFPGTIGEEYYLTKGHFHSRREAAELYIGLRGEGRMLLEDETTGESTVVDLLPNSSIYVPGHTAHRTVNVGKDPLVYIGIYPAVAGHDYGEIAGRNFRTVIIERAGKPATESREQYLRTLLRVSTDTKKDEHS